jgi:aminopeptidase N
MARTTRERGCRRMERRRVFALILVLLSLTACGIPERLRGLSGRGGNATRVAPHPFDAAWDDRSIYREGLVSGEQEVLERLPGATVYHIDVEISRDRRRVEGHEKVRYTNQENGSLDDVYFRLFPNATGGEAIVSGVKVGDQDVEAVYEFEDSAVRVPLPDALQPGETVDIEMGFEVKVPLEMAGNYGLLVYYDDVLALDGFYPVIPVYDDEGWNVEVPPANADTSYYDASFYLVRVTAPADLVVVASGIEVGRESEGGEQVLTFAAGPARDFYIAASDRYVVVSDTVGETTINSYVLSDGKDDRTELSLHAGVGALESFGTRFGTYPYTEFDIASTPMLALGIEYPGVTGITLSLYEPDAEMVALEGTIVHEIGHQWFYNVVGNDQVDEPWLDEAVVQYVVGLYYADTYGAQAQQAWQDGLDQRWSRVGYAEIPIGKPAESYEGREYGAIVYGRGPLFIAALAEEMGQDTFDAFLKDYYQTHRWGIGTGEAFRGLAEHHCQCDLTALFEEWVWER